MNDSTVLLGSPSIKKYYHDLLDLPKIYLTILKIIPLLLMYLIICYLNLHFTDLRIARNGWSYSGILLPILKPDEFINNFPNGAENLAVSLYMSAFLFIYHCFKINPIILTKLQICIDIFLLMLSGVVAVRYLRPKSSYYAYLVVIAVLLIGSARAPNLARFSVPFFGYEPYCAAEFFAITGCLAVLYNRIFVSASLLAISVMCHPIIGLFGCLFSASSMIPVWKQYVRPSAISALLLFLAMVLPWLWMHLPSSSLGLSKIPDVTWVELGRMMNFHLFPVQMGVVSFASWKILFPYLASSILLFFYLGFSPEQDEISKRVGYGSLAILLVSMVGLLLPSLGSPFLIKLALTRASAFLLFFAVIYTTCGLWQDAQSNKPLLSFVAAILLIYPFISPHGYSLYWTIALIVFSWRLWYRADVSSSILTGYIALALFASLVYWYFGYAQLLKGPAFWGQNLLFKQKMLYKSAILVYLAGAYFLRKQPFRLYFLLTGILVMVSIAMYGQHKKIERNIDADRLNAYKSAQIWSSKHTEPGSLFMIPPGPFNGWIDFSHRPSFGTLRTWLHDSWLYNSSYPLYQQGLERAELFNVNIDRYTHGYQGVDGYRALLREMNDYYYSRPSAWYDDLSKKFNIYYFVFDKNKLKTNITMKKVYENSYYSIYLSKQKT